MFDDNAAPVSLWLQTEGFEIEGVRSPTTRWDRIRFTVEFDDSENHSENHSGWGREFLDGHNHVIL